MLFLATLLVLLSAANRALATKFMDTCSDVRFYNPDYELHFTTTWSPFLVAKCKDPGSGCETCSFLPLMHCYSNAAGFLRPSKQGNFHKSCFNCQYEETGTEMTCRCFHNNAGRSTTESSIFLEDHVQNLDGRLWCQGIVGEVIDCNEYELTKLRKIH
ncbi:hypothetical protein CMUS01_03170 [Colletotrichum musicola]|uniref:Cyanovirin-N domain-containing protein n=1 Tax=Colletotrichum musicola TaxID=2175873 RepID=A0A8H6U6Y7_9PEZI|nr:hypothetical protein CMUS01_03170 [Colletotrichum musicola]